jgi:hypothetical protein
MNAINILVPTLTQEALEHWQGTCGRFPRSFARQREVHNIVFDPIFAPDMQSEPLGAEEESLYFLLWVICRY